MKKFKIGNIVYFKPTYWPDCISGPLIDTFQVIGFDKKNKMYHLVYFNDIDLNPVKPFLTTVLEVDIDDISNSIYKDKFKAVQTWFPIDMDFNALRRDDIYKINEGIIYFLSNRDKYNNDLNVCINKNPKKFHIIIHDKS